MIARVRQVVVFVLLVPVMYVVSSIVYFPAVVWHARFAPSGSALIAERAREAADERNAWSAQSVWVPGEAISKHLVHAVLAGEDSAFFEHRGFDVEQIRDAWRSHRRTGRSLRGASTITQQTVKNLYLSPSRSVLRKVREAALTVWMELWVPKERIMELYLNVVELGRGVFGVGAASELYFGRTAGRVSADQAALLAATLPAPLVRNPGARTAGLDQRSRLIRARMAKWYEGPAPAPEPAAEQVERRESEPLTLEEVAP